MFCHVAYPIFPPVLNHLSLIPAIRGALSSHTSACHSRSHKPEGCYTETCLIKSQVTSAKSTRKGDLSSTHTI